MYTYCGKRAGHANAMAGLGTISYPGIDQSVIAYSISPNAGNQETKDARFRQTTPVAELAAQRTKEVLGMPQGLLQNPLVIAAGLIAGALYLRGR